MTSPQPIVDVLRASCDRLLDQARDRWGGTPLFADGVDAATGAAVRWTGPAGGEAWILSDLANQQRWLRSLVVVSALTGDAAYRQAALAAVGHALRRCADGRGLLPWGGHLAWDLAGGQAVGMDSFHELKLHCPDYDLMWQADPAATRAFVEGFWDAHILDWSRLDMNRHGRFGLEARTSRVWDETYAGGPVFFPSDGLSFANTGCDLMLAAAQLAALGGDMAPLAWARRLLGRYLETRDPETGLGGYQFTCLRGGDRAQGQFGPELGPGVLEGRILDRSRAERKVAEGSLVLVAIAGALGRHGGIFLRTAVEDCLAWARHAFDAGRNLGRAVLLDGRILSAEDVRRPGYYQAASLAPWTLDGRWLRAYAAVWRASGEAALWPQIRAMAAGLGLGDIGADARCAGRRQVATACADPLALHGLIALGRGGAPLLPLARQVAANLIATRFHDGCFRDRPGQRRCRIDRDETLALAHLAAWEDGLPEPAPALPATAFFTCHHHGLGRVTDNAIIYGGDAELAASSATAG